MVPDRFITSLDLSKVPQESRHCRVCTCSPSRKASSRVVPEILPSMIRKSLPHNGRHTNEPMLCARPGSPDPVTGNASLLLTHTVELAEAQGREQRTNHTIRLIE